MAKVTMPQLGESVAEGTIGKWLKQPGDHVDKYEPLLEVITDKVNAEVPSPFEGILREILAEEGATVPNNAEIAVIETADDGAADAAAAGAPAPVATPSRPRAAPRPRRADRCGRRAPTMPAPAAAARVGAGSAGRPRAEPAPAASARTRPSPRGRRIRAGLAGRRRRAPRPRPRRPPTADPDARMTPGRPAAPSRARPRAPAQIVGTGGGGRITREDVLHFVEAMRNGHAGSGAAHPPGDRDAAPVGRRPPRQRPPAAPAPTRTGHARGPRRRALGPPARPSRSRSPRAPTKSSSR